MKRKTKKDKQIDIKRIKELANSLSVFINNSKIPIVIEYEEPGVKIVLQKNSISRSTSKANTKESPQSGSENSPQLIEIKATEIGHFTPLIEEGDKIGLKHKIGIIESEGFPTHDITIDKSLVVKKICVKKGTFVEYGQVLFQLQSKGVK